MRKIGGELGILGVLVVLGAAVAIGGAGYQVLGAGGRIAPGFMPFVSGLALAGFGAWAIVESAVKRRREAAASPPSPAPSDGDGGTNTVEGQLQAPDSGRRVAVVFGMAVVAAAITIVTGFLLAFGLLVLALMWFVEKERPWVAIVVSVVATLTCWVVFVQLFQVPLPGGMIGLLGRI